MTVRLTKHIRSLRGGSQPHLMQADNGNLYVVKFQGNPQGTSVLVNEMLAAKLAELLGLPVSTTTAVELPAKLSETLYFETPSGRTPVSPGIHLGSKLVISHLEGRSYDCLPRSFSSLVRNPDDLIGIDLFDLWTCNRDIRQSVYWKRSQEKKYTVTFIDNGHCFGGPEWRFAPIGPLPSAPAEPSRRLAWRKWVDRIATFPIRQFESLKNKLVPEEWCAGESLGVIYEELAIRQALFASDQFS